MAQLIECWPLIEKVPGSKPAAYRRISVGKNEIDLITGFSKYTGTDVLVKSVQSKVPTA